MQPGEDLVIDLGPFEDESACEVERIDLPTRDHAAVPTSTRLADHTTLRLGGPARELVVATTEAEVVAAVTEADAAGTPVLILSGGSNLVIGDDGFDGRVVRIATRGIDVETSACYGAQAKVAAGENWDDFVALCVEREWIGVETLSGIPGLVGSTPIQNVGAYGAEVSQVISRVRTLDRRSGHFKTFFPGDCQFSYRNSLFKQHPDRYVILEVTFQMLTGPLSAPIRYPELARTLGVEAGQRAPLGEVRDQVLAIRRSKGMVLDESDHDTWSAGSFFTNPILTPDEAATLPAEAPRFEQPDGRVKSSAAWLIAHAGFEKGHRLTARPDAPVSLSTKHTLALTNRGGATSADLAELAREVRDGVEAKFGIPLVPEPVRVNCDI
ncbi:UDP-N-acetylmuramate dehydrogenase [Propionibacteriaceae bacterium Y1923]|uniref:UDP-N-acetylmuramate dehydrogenase n=1 Tax=Aestuariimicrobium sp. Y1814 TaxID=3418742 RepID=UPI003C1C0553